MRKQAICKIMRLLYPEQCSFPDAMLVPNHKSLARNPNSPPKLSILILHGQNVTKLGVRFSSMYLYLPMIWSFYINRKLDVKLKFADKSFSGQQFQ